MRNHDREGDFTTSVKSRQSSVRPLPRSTTIIWKQADLMSSDYCHILKTDLNCTFFLASNALFCSLSRFKISGVQCQLLKVGAGRACRALRRALRTGDPSSPEPGATLMSQEQGWGAVGAAHTAAHRGPITTQCALISGTCGAI